MGSLVILFQVIIFINLGNFILIKKILEDSFVISSLHITLILWTDNITVHSIVYSSECNLFLCKSFSSNKS